MTERGRSAKRRVLGLLIALVLVEFLAWVAFVPLDGSLFSPSRLRSERAALAGLEHAGGVEPAAIDDEILLRMKDQVVHPYVGYVFDPAMNSPEVFELLGEREVTELGFVGRPGFFETAAPDRVVVGLTGGSVALFFSIHGTEALAERLAREPEFQGKQIRFVTFALLGFKQPQQLQALAYLMALGAHFDWVLNLDGFNEVTLPRIENVPEGVSAVFPRSWSWRVAGTEDPALRRLTQEALFLESERSRLAADFQSSAWTWSASASLIWRLRDRGRAGRLAELEAEILAARASTAAPFVARGPFRDPASEADPAWLVDLWRRSSLAMHALCTGQDVRYLHALQPNQYVEGSKPMGEPEARLAVSPTSRFAGPVREGYPLLARAGAELAAAGVDFHDFTQLFADVPAPLYEDNCCHVNSEGNRLLALALANAMLAGLR